jgi:hypothetical protein
MCREFAGARMIAVAPRPAARRFCEESGAMFERSPASDIAGLVPAWLTRQPLRAVPRLCNPKFHALAPRS